MILDTTNTKDIRYIDRDFTELRKNLITYSKTYFPNTFTDFSEASPAMGFIEMSAYVGDILSFYLDTQVQECFLQYARQSNSLYNHAYQRGYKPKQTTVSVGTVDVFQQVPAKIENSQYVPDYNYGLLIPVNTTVSTGGSSVKSFITTKEVDFCHSSSLDPTEATVYEIDGNGDPLYYLLKKSVKVMSGQISTITRRMGDYKEFPTVDIQNGNIIGILSITDDNNNVYYEVDHLGQDTVFEKVENNSYNDPNKSTDASDANYILNTFRTERRFVSRFKEPGLLEIQFGAGRESNISDEDALPNQNNVGIGLPFTQDRLTTAYSPQNFIFTNTYGIAPTNTLLRIKILTGGGLGANVPANQLVNIGSTSRFKSSQGIVPSIANFIAQTVSCNNTQPTTGGKGGDTLNEIRINTMGEIHSQMRTVTLMDYQTRVLAMPGEYGAISKIYAEKPQLEDAQTSTLETVSIYTLGYNSAGKLAYLTDTVKQNIRTYLNEFKMVGDTCEIRDAFIINFGVNFDIVARPNYNNNSVLANCIRRIRDYFVITNRQINQPIQLRELYVILDRVEGVQTVSNIEIINKAGAIDGYSQYAYDIEGATMNRVIYPALDPSIFELRYPLQDIKGRVVNF